MINNEDFYKEHCLGCGTQRCPADDEAIASCRESRSKPDLPLRPDVIRKVEEKYGTLHPPRKEGLE